MTDQMAFLPTTNMHYTRQQRNRKPLGARPCNYLNTTNFQHVTGYIKCSCSSVESSKGKKLATGTFAHNALTHENLNNPHKPTEKNLFVISKGSKFPKYCFSCAQFGLCFNHA